MMGVVYSMIPVLFSSLSSDACLSLAEDTDSSIYRLFPCLNMASCWVLVTHHFHFFLDSLTLIYLVGKTSDFF